MQFIENIRLAFTSLLANKMRALLTMLGIIIGISAVIMITTIGTSIQKTLTRTFNSIGNFNYFRVDLWIHDPESDGGWVMDELIDRDMVDELIAKYPDQFMLDLNDSFGNVTTQNYKGQIITLSVNGSMDAVPASDHKRGRTIQYKDNKNLKNALYVSDLFIKQYFPEGTDKQKAAKAMATDCRSKVPA